MGSISINSNPFALNAQRRVSQTSSELSRSFERLSSGMRINRGSDDAAGVSVAMSLGAGTRVFSQAVRNVNDGLSALNIADGSLDELSQLTTRQLELATQAANGSLSLTQRRALQLEASKLSDEYNRQIQTTSFNGNRLLMYVPNTQLSIQSGYGTNGSIGFNQNSELSRVSGTGTYSYGSGGTFLGGSNVTAIAVDWNSDGRPDIASYSAATGEMSVEIGNGNGTFASALVFGNFQPLFAADTNGDGREDLIATNMSTGQTVTFVLSGGGSYSLKNSGVLTGGAPTATADFNGDGRLDVITDSGSALYVYTAKTDGSFQLLSQVNHAAGTVKTGDFNGDGQSDFTVDNGASTTVYMNQGSGNFKANSVSGGLGNGIVIGDFNRDGYDDIFSLGFSSYKVLSGNGDGSFSASAVTSTTMVLNGVMDARDFDGDGFIDVFSGSSSQYTLAIGNGNGTFNTNTNTLTVTSSSNSFIIADFNTDGVMDLGLTNLGTGGTSDLQLGGTSRTTASKYVSLLTAADARQAITTLQAQLARISLERGQIGSMQSRLGAALGAATSTAENLQGARSRIIDADIASEAANATRLTILQQAGAAVLSQANQIPALALRLLSV